MPSRGAGQCSHGRTSKSFLTTLSPLWMGFLLGTFSTLMKQIFAMILAVKVAFSKKGPSTAKKFLTPQSRPFQSCSAGRRLGRCCPPMVVYKALNLYTSWCDRGPKGTVYSTSKSGWFDMFQFERWFVDLLLPRHRRRPGKKMIVGDNLSSHLSPTVINLCRQHNISFVCLPPNSTDKLQPLDVGVFAPLKAAWRKVLSGNLN